jgi:hypothetical protein
LDTAVKVCPKLSRETALSIEEEVWKSQGDIREVIAASKLVKKSDRPEQISQILETFRKYGD